MPTQMERLVDDVHAQPALTKNVHLAFSGCGCLPLLGQRSPN